MIRLCVLSRFVEESRRQRLKRQARRLKAESALQVGWDAAGSLSGLLCRGMHAAWMRAAFAADELPLAAEAFLYFAKQYVSIYAVCPALQVLRLETHRLEQALAQEQRQLPQLQAQLAALQKAR